MISQQTKHKIDLECFDSMSLREKSVACQQALLEADDEAGAYNLYNVHDTCGPPAGIRYTDRRQQTSRAPSAPVGLSDQWYTAMLTTNSRSSLFLAQPQIPPNLFSF